MNWFDVDKQGLAKILERRGKAFALLELVSNALDTDASKVEVRLEPIAGRPMVAVTVIDDDPKGFENLAHAWTLFAESNRKGDSSKRGRFNLGEKLVLAVCETAEILTVSSGVRFDQNGRHTLRRRTDLGSVFLGHVRMTREELEEATEALAKVIPPRKVKLTLDGVEIKHRLPVATFDVELPTEAPDADGNLKRTTRKTTVNVYEPFGRGTDSYVDEDGIPGWRYTRMPGWLYELGIPVVETGDRFDVDVGQKIPLNMDRDNVPPAFLAKLRAEVLNHTAALVKGSQENAAAWVRDALAHPDIEPVALKHSLTERFGEKAVIDDPSDPEGTKIAVSEGYTVVHGGTLSKGEWENVKRAEALLPAGQVTPSPKPFSADGAPLKLLAFEKWTDAMKARADYIEGLSRELIGRQVQLQIANDFAWRTAACAGPDSAFVIVNLARVGHRWFEAGDCAVEVTALLLHELAHADGAVDHLSNEFHAKCCELGAKMVRLALDGKLGKR